MKRIAQFAFVCLLICFNLWGCSANRKVLDAEISPAPTHASLYYFFAGTYSHYSGDYLVADTAFRKALSYDYHSYQTHRFLLLNSIYSYLNGGMEQEKFNEAVTFARERIVLDELSLHNLYNCYRANGDSLGLELVLSELEERYPTARIHFLRFADTYNRGQRLDTDALQRSLNANPDPELLFTIAQIYAELYPPQALEILERLNKENPTQESIALQQDLLLRLPDKSAAIEKFSSYSYPQDLDLMQSFLEQSLRLGEGEFILSLSDQIISTGDADLLESLATSAYFFADIAVLKSIENYLNSFEASSLSRGKLYAIILANAVLREGKRDLTAYSQRLHSSGDIESILSLYIIYRNPSLSERSEDIAPQIFTSFFSVWKGISGDTAVGDYLQVFARFLQENATEADLAQAKLEIAQVLYDRGMGSDVDLAMLLSAYSADDQSGERISILRRAHELYPDNAIFLNALGYSLLFEEGHLEEAGSLIRQAISLDPENPFILDSIAWYHYLKGDYSLALQNMQIPMQQEDIPSEISYHIGRIYLALEQLEDAKLWLLRASQGLETDGFPTKAAELLKSLQ